MEGTQPARQATGRKNLCIPKHQEFQKQVAFCAAGGVSMSVSYSQSLLSVQDRDCAVERVQVEPLWPLAENKTGGRFLQPWTWGQILFFQLYRLSLATFGITGRYRNALAQGRYKSVCNIPKKEAVTFEPTSCTGG